MPHSIFFYYDEFISVYQAPYGSDLRVVLLHFTYNCTKSKSHIQSFKKRCTKIPEKNHNSIKIENHRINSNLLACNISDCNAMTLKDKFWFCRATVGDNSLYKSCAGSVETQQPEVRLKKEGPLSRVWTRLRSGLKKQIRVRGYKNQLKHTVCHKELQLSHGIWLQKYPDILTRKKKKNYKEFKGRSSATAAMVLEENDCDSVFNPQITVSIIEKFG